MYRGLSGEPEVWIIEGAECYISYESWLSSVAWNYEIVDKGRFIPDWVLCQAQLGKCCTLRRQTSIIISGAAGCVPSVHSKCPFFMCQFRTRWGKTGHECALIFCQVPGCLDTPLGQTIPPRKIRFFSQLRVLQRSRRIRERRLRSIATVDTLEGDKGANNHSYLPESQCKS